MKKILIIHYSMEIGGAESSLLGILQSFDYSKVQVDLLLLRKGGEFFDLIPKEVNILDTPKQYQNIVAPIKDALKSGSFAIAFSRLIGKFIVSRKQYSDITYVTKQFCHKLALPFLPRLKGKYDLAISFIDPHYIIGKKVMASKKLAWLHTDFSRIEINKKMDYSMWNMSDYVVNVSQSCKYVFDKTHPELINKSIVIENILTKTFVFSCADSFQVDFEITDDDCINILSIGRFTDQKNFDNVPAICRKLIETGIKVKWYLIGYGSDEELIKRRIAEKQMEKNVIILGKKNNPYPYIKKCDIYVQPSRYEGKCVTVREAQILNKPVIISDYATAGSQLVDGLDGIIVPMDNEGCARGIARVIKDKDLQNRLIENTKCRDYTNVREIEKIYEIMNMT